MQLKNKMMMSTHIRPTGRLWRWTCLCLVFNLFLIPAVQAAATESDQEIKEETILAWMHDSFVYRREGRPDPFEPFLPEKLVHIDVPTEELTGMRRYEPGQLTLVSIVFTEKEPIAMVQDSAGKGYLLRRGSKIGRSGVVSGIAPNEIIIQQQMLTATGEKKTQAVEMVLRKEGEK